MKSTLWIGVDVSKDSFHAAYRRGEGFCPLLSKLAIREVGSTS